MKCLLCPRGLAHGSQGCWEWHLLFPHGGRSQVPEAKATKANRIFVLKDNTGVKTRGNKMDRNKLRLEIRGKSVPREQPEQ